MVGMQCLAAREIMGFTVSARCELCPSKNKSPFAFVAEGLSGTKL